MKWIIFIVIFFILAKFPMLRFIVLHPFQVIPHAISDGYNYIKYKKYNNCMEYGKIRLNSAKTSQVFGCGKTLSLVKIATAVYYRYNNKPVWSDKEKKFVTQKIHIISNVALYNVPYIPWKDETQFTMIDKMGFPEQDIIIYLLDEAGTIFNSRQFRDNISMEFLTRLLQSRKNKMCLYMTSQRFQFTDKILRESCSVVTTCQKKWRIIELCDYDAFEVENVANVSMLRPIATKYWLAKDRDYHSYDSYQLIEKLKKVNDSNGFLSTEEILNTYGENSNNVDNINPKHINKTYLKKGIKK